MDLSQQNAKIGEALSAGLGEMAGMVLTLRDETGLYGVVNELDAVTGTKGMQRMIGGKRKLVQQAVLGIQRVLEHGDTTFRVFQHYSKGRERKK